MEREILGMMVPMMVLKKEIYEFIENLFKEKVQEIFKDQIKKQLLTIEEAANYLNVKVSWIRQAIFRKEINHVKVGALIRFREEDLQSFIQSKMRHLNPG
jgi:excisionase family DNA binding protein